MLNQLKNKILIGKEEYILNAAEIHYFTVNKRYWSICFERIKKAGFKIISSAIPWNLHEISMGDFDFMGETDSRRDLVVFLELAREFGFKIILKIGPYVGAEWENGGYPDFVTDNQEIAAKNAQGKPVTISEQEEFPDIVLPSYNHPIFKSHCKRYINALAKVLKNYIYPKGPVIIVKLGKKSSYSFFTSPFLLDYNTYTVNELYPAFLKDEYREIKTLKSEYRSKAKNFNEISPPTEEKIKKPEDLIKYLDWVKFKSGLVSNYILNLRDIFLSSQVTPLFFTDVFWEGDSLSSSEKTPLQRENIFAGVESNWFKNYAEYSWHLRSFVGSTSFPWAIEFMIGAPAYDPEMKKRYLPIRTEEIKFMLITSLALGLKGFNHTMFVETGRWYGTPLAEDGTIREGYEFIKSFNLLLEKIDLSNLESLVQISLMNYNPYLYLSQLENQKLFPYIKHLVKQTHFRLSEDLRGLKCDYRIFSLEHEKAIDKFKILFVPCAEFMDLETQSFLLELVRRGKSLILYGLLPRYDLRFKSCGVLAKGLRMKTSPSYQVDKVQASKLEFPSQLYGFIRTHPRNYQVVARSGKRIVGVKGKIGKGRIYFFTFDISTLLNHKKLGFLNHILEDAGITKFLNCSDTEVEVIVQKNEKVTLLYIMSPGIPLTSESKGSKRDIILQIDCKKIGVRGKRISLTELFSGELIKTTADVLRKGITLEMGRLEGRIYQIDGSR